MEYNFSKHSVGVKSTFLDTVNEQIVDVDINLPDYCPDIEKILKCILTWTSHNRAVRIRGKTSIRAKECSVDNGARTDIP